MSELIKASVTSDEFVNKNGHVIFDSELGIVGWRGKREIDDPPKLLKNKCSILFETTNG